MLSQSCVGVFLFCGVGNEQLGGKMEVSRGYSLYEAAAAAAAAAAEEEEEDYNMT